MDARASRYHDVYARWQRDLGYSGAGANGIPGPTSLTRLGANRFEVTRRIDEALRTEPAP